MKVSELDSEKLLRLSRDVDESQKRHKKAMAEVEKANKEVKDAFESLQCAMDVLDVYLETGE